MTKERRLWGFGPSIDVMQRTADLATGRPPALEWLNRDDFSDFVSGRGEATDAFGLPLGQVAGVDLADAPMAKWRCVDPDFAPDLIFEGALFASRRLRDAMALDRATVQYLPIDCSECPPAMRGADYSLVNLLVFANPLDRARTEPAEFADVALPGGGSTFVWTAPPWQPGRPVPRHLWRSDFAAPAPLFRVPGISWTLATDDLADRVMRAGLEEVAFMDVENDGTRTDGIILRES